MLTCKYFAYKYLFIKAIYATAMGSISTLSNKTLTLLTYDNSVQFSLSICVVRNSV